MTDMKLHMGFPLTCTRLSRAYLALARLSCALCLQRHEHFESEALPPKCSWLLTFTLVLETEMTSHCLSTIVLKY